jgi:hypothetical protein
VLCRRPRRGRLRHSQRLLAALWREKMPQWAAVIPRRLVPPLPQQQQQQQDQPVMVQLLWVVLLAVAAVRLVIVPLHQPRSRDSSGSSSSFPRPLQHC